MRPSELSLRAVIVLVLLAGCGGADAPEGSGSGGASGDTLAPGMVTGTTGAPGPGTAGTPGTPGAVNPETIPAARDTAGGI